VHVLRLALTLDQIRTHRLPSFAADTKAKDPRHRWYLAQQPLLGASPAEGGRCWELDALSPVVLRQVVDTAILSRIDTTSWDRYAAVEHVERASLKLTLGNWKAALTPMAPASPAGATGAI